jgi:type IV fimbrial biogenesis protein FimT
VRAASGPSTFASAIEAKSGAEGSGTAASAVVVVSGSASGATWDGVIAFDGFGRTVTSASYTLDIKRAGAQCIHENGNVRCRRIVISPGGQIQSCDPAASAAVGDTRGCS